MEMVAPSGPVYQAGTLSGNPVAMAAGLANLDLITVEGFYERLETQTRRLLDGLKGEAEAAGIPLLLTQAGAMFGLFFTGASRVINFAEAGQCDTAAFRRFFHFMLERGVYLAPSAYEAGFVSAAHTVEHIESTIHAAREAFAAMAA
jgi:glutamate-1-semialdehyde 2,1-aminomutase